MPLGPREGAFAPSSNGPRRGMDQNCWHLLLLIRMGNDLICI